MSDTTVDYHDMWRCSKADVAAVDSSLKLYLRVSLVR